MNNTCAGIARFRTWKEQLSAQPQWIRHLDEWLFTNASSVLFAEKPGELLTLDMAALDILGHDVEAQLEARCKAWDLGLHILCRTDTNLKVIIFVEERTAARLTMVPPCVLHEQLGYPRNMTTATFLNVLSFRWNKNGTIPHEIGFVLGYEVDDVMGFMGMLALECKGFCGWQVYGNLDEAQRLRQSYLTARCRALDFLTA